MTKILGLDPLISDPEVPQTFEAEFWKLPLGLTPKLLHTYVHSNTKGSLKKALGRNGTAAVRVLSKVLEKD